MENQARGSVISKRFKRKGYAVYMLQIANIAGELSMSGGEKEDPIKEVNWKVEATHEGIAKIEIKVNDKVFKKSLAIGDFRGALSNKKYKDSSFGHFIYPAEGLLPEADTLENIYIQYPGKNVSFAGIRTHWLVFNLVLVVIIVLAFRKRFGVEF